MYGELTCSCKPSCQIPACWFPKAGQAHGIFWHQGNVHCKSAFLGTGPAVTARKCRSELWAAAKLPICYAWKDLNHSINISHFWQKSLNHQGYCHTGKLSNVLNFYHVNAAVSLSLTGFKFLIVNWLIFLIAVDLIFKYF